MDMTTTAAAIPDGSQAALQRRIKALRLPPGADDQTRAMFSNLRRHGPRMPAQQAEKLIALIEQAGQRYVLSEALQAQDGPAT
jgi:hypothetical protein